MRYFLGNEAVSYHPNLEGEQKETLAQFEYLLTLYPEILMAEQSSSSWVDLYRKGLIFNNNKLIKAKFSITLQACVLGRELNVDQFVQLLTPLYKTTLVVAYISIDRAMSYFMTASYLIDKCQDEEKKKRLVSIIHFEDIWRKVLPTLLRSTDQSLLESIFKFLKSSLFYRDDIKTWAEDNKGQLVEMLSLYLIDPSGKQKEKPVIQVPETKQAFLHFIKEVLLIEPTLRDPVCSFFNSLFTGVKWRKRRTDSWEFEIGIEEDKVVKYSGLINQGCTCYVNSVFQQLFMVEDFRNFIIEAPAEPSSIMLQCRRLLRGLRDSGKPSLPTRNFSNVFTNFDGSTLNPLEQMDADEFFNNLMDKMESSLKKNGQEGIIRRTFGGKIIQEVVGCDCKHRSSRETEFLTLSLDVKGRTSIKQSLEKFVEGELLDGENLYSCDNCNKKVKAFKRESFKHLPNKILITLKRFEFNYETMTKHKVNSYCEFPETLEMRPYSSDSLSEGVEENDRPSEYFKYQLAGVIIHTGTTDSGHYYSLIKTPDKKWLEFNDTLITDFNLENLPTIAFGHKLDYSQTGLPLAGGLNSPSSPAHPNQSRGTSAYMLLYEREALFDEQDNRLQSLMQNIPVVQPEAENEEEKQIQVEYFENQLRRLVLDVPFADWLKDCIGKISEESIGERDTDSLMQLTLFVFLYAQVRAKYKTLALNMAEAIINKLKTSPKLSLWLISNIANQDFLNEFGMDCPRLIAKELVFSTVLQAIKTLIDSDSPVISNSGLMASEVSSTSPKHSPKNPKDVSFSIFPVKQLMLLCFESVLKSRENDLQRLNGQLFKVLEVCSSHLQLSKILIRQKFPEKMLYIIGLSDFEKYFSDKGEKGQSQQTIFKGYDGTGGGSVLEETLAERRTEALQNRLFRFDYSYLIMAVLNVIEANPKESGDIVKALFEKELWSRVIRNCQSNNSRSMCTELVLENCGEREDQIERVLARVLEMTNDRDIPFTQLKSFLYLLRVLHTQAKVKKVQTLAVIQSLVLKGPLRHVDYTMSYLFRILKDKPEEFERVGGRASDFYQKYLTRLQDFAILTKKESAKGTSSTGSVVIDLNSMAEHQLEKRKAQLNHLARLDFARFKETILYDSDEEADYTQLRDTDIDLR